VDLFNCVLLEVGYAVALVLGYLLLIPLMLLAQIPIESVQDFVLLKLLRPVLTAGAGEFKVYLDDELQAANIRRRVGDAARALLQLPAFLGLTLLVGAVFWALYRLIQWKPHFDRESSRRPPLVLALQGGSAIRALV
jgi:hypothetical protein